MQEGRHSPARRPPTPTRTTMRFLLRTFVIASLGLLALSLGAGRASAQQRDPVAALTKLLRDDNVDVRRAAAKALTRMPHTEAAVPALVAALKDEDPFVRDNAVDALCSMPPAEVVPGLIRALKDPNQNSRRRGAEALMRLGHYVEDAIPDLILLLKDEHEEVREAATAALRRILVGRWD